MPKRLVLWTILALLTLPILCHAASPSEATWQTLAPQRTSPAGLVQILGWNDPAKLPPGVVRVLPLAGEDGLLVKATPNGQTQAQAALTTLEADTRRVRLHIVFVRARVTDVDAFGLNFSLAPLHQTWDEYENHPPAGYVHVASGPIVVQLFQALSKTRGLVSPAPDQVVRVNMEAVVPAPVYADVPYEWHSGFHIMPHVRPDGAITLYFVPRPSFAALPSVAVAPPYQTWRTVPSGGMMVLSGFLVPTPASAPENQMPVLGQYFSNRVFNTKAEEWLVFITPTVVTETPPAP